MLGEAGERVHAAVEDQAAPFAAKLVGDPARGERADDRRCVERRRKVARLQERQLELVLDKDEDAGDDANVVAEEQRVE